MVFNDFASAEIATHGSTATASAWRRLLLQLVRMRFQVAGGFLFAVLLPTVMRRGIPREDVLQIFDATFYGSFWSFLFGYLFFRKVTAYPGVRATAFILPSFLAAYAAVAVVALWAGFAFSLEQAGLSLGLSAIFFYAVFFLSRRVRTPELAVVPVGDFRRLFQLGFVNWRTIATPEHARGRMPIVVDLKADLSPEWERFITDSALSGRAVYSAKQVYESLSGRVLVEHLSENTFGSVIPNSIYASAKRYCDSTLALAAFIFLSPFLLLVALLVRMDSAGPSLFRQQRMGYGGRPFTVYKFRTMQVSAVPHSAASAVTRPDDARITRVGRILRRSRIDELPQILNIIKGEMSWIGPRPEALSLSEWYEKKIAFYRYRHLVRPGITGWAQVNQGHVTELADVDVKLQYDFFYVKHFSLWLDILVVLKTMRVILTGRGAR